MAHTKQVEEFSTDVQKVLNLNETTQQQPRSNHTVANLDTNTTVTANTTTAIADAFNTNTNTNTSTNTNTT